MNKRMLIDAAHVEETRVALIDERGHLLDFDFASTTKQTVKGNVYLAKIARVEPSLQAAFVEYGGNRHGFLAFSEIHPDYFRIPVSDRAAFDAEVNQQASADDEPIQKTNGADDGADDGISSGDDDDVDTVRRPSLHRLYKIQEVIQKNQIVLIQVVKEERGGKGAALTTYLSVAGRYCVLMPNSPRSGGISRKIAVAADRARLRKILDDLSIPDGMGLIVRTAGKERTKTEIKKDAEYLMRAWNNIREQTLGSVAPALIYEEDDIIKRAIRDLYTKDVTDISVDGDEGYKIARAFMKNLLPSHVKKIQPYKDLTIPMFHRYGVEKQIDEMHNATVRLPSGGSIVLHPTEALVSIDINSGKSTRERHIEETALKTNLEAADEIARQVRLRDLAGLIVVDFIDMDDARHVSSVERRVREAFKNDRARVQVGRISPFGLMELSRQRLRPSLLETSTHPCPHCQATGFIRSTESSTLSMLRVLEDEGISRKSTEILLEVPNNVAFYLLNSKRSHIQSIESRHDILVQIQGNDTLMTGQYTLTRIQKRDDEDGVVSNDGANGVKKPAEERSVVRPFESRTRSHGAAQPRPVDVVQAVVDPVPPKNNETMALAAPTESEEGASSSASLARRNRRNRMRQRRREERQKQTVSADGNELNPESEQTIVPVAAIRDSAVTETDGGLDVDKKQNPRNRRNRSRHQRPVGPRDSETAINQGDKESIGTPIPGFVADNAAPVATDGPGKDPKPAADGVPVLPATPKNRQARGWLRRLLD